MTSEALRVDGLALEGFRNLAPLQLRPGARFNVLHGENGAGKSNLLEAIDYLGTLRSFRGARTDDLVAEDADAAELGMRVLGDLAPRRYRVRLRRQGARQVAVDGKRPRSRAAYLRSVHVVLFHPGDIALATGAPEGRRAFMDRILEQLDATYASSLAAYQRSLRSRNRLLKQDRPDRRAIGAYDELLASAGAVVARTRADLVDELSPRIEGAFEQITQAALPLQVQYQPRVEPDVGAMHRALEQSLDKDLARGFTGEGPHADELAFVVRKSRAKHFASQGQHRALVLAMRVAELYELERRVGKVPILLLDDVSSELDRTRNRRLFEVLGQLGGQVFLTTTHPEFILLEQDRHDFHVRNGAVQPAS